MPELYELGALELVRPVRAREVSRRQVLEANLDRIEAVAAAAAVVDALEPVSVAEPAPPPTDSRGRP